MHLLRQVRTGQSPYSGRPSHDVLVLRTASLSLTYRLPSLTSSN